MLLIIAGQIPLPLSNKKQVRTNNIHTCLVGVTGLEPATSRPPAVRASQLRHTPEIKIVDWVSPDDVPGTIQVGIRTHEPRLVQI